MNTPIRPFQGGNDNIRARLNEIVNAVNTLHRSLRSVGFINTSIRSEGKTGHVSTSRIQSRIPKIGGGGPGTPIKFALITSKVGTEPPYKYAAEEAIIDVDGNWSAVGSGGITYDNVFNMEEQGDGGQWVNPLLVGDVVAIVAGPGGEDVWVCWRSHYRGTY